MATVITSWDDADKYTPKIVSLLNKYRLKGTFFVPIKAINYSLSLRDLRAISKCHEIGAHTINHPNLLTLNDDNLWSEISGSKLLLEKYLGTDILSFCYPGGYFNERVKSVVIDAEFLLARTVHEYEFEPTNDLFQIGTSIHVKNKTIPLFSKNFMKIFKFSPDILIKLDLLNDWFTLATFLFDVVLARDGLFHIWGHSWEVEKEENWVKLEKLFKYISNRKNVNYCSLADFFINNIV